MTRQSKTIDQTSEQVIDSSHNKGLNWIFCYNNFCLLYFGEKKGLKWFSKTPRNQKQLAMDRHRPLYNTVLNNSDSNCFNSNKNYYNPKNPNRQPSEKPDLKTTIFNTLLKTPSNTLQQKKNPAQKAFFKF